MDWLEWIVRGSGVAFALLLLIVGYLRLNPGETSTEVPLAWMALLALVGVVLLISLIANWMFPIDVRLYVANGSTTTFNVLVGDGIEFCLPGKSYRDMNWRVDAPDRVTVTAMGTGAVEHYKIGRGTWLINVTADPVTADLENENSDALSYNGVFSNSRQSVHVGGRFDRALQFYSQLPIDRLYSREGGMTSEVKEGPCAGAPGTVAQHERK